MMPQVTGRIALRNLVADAERAGFNPLTVLRNGGAAGYAVQNLPDMPAQEPITISIGGVLTADPAAVPAPAAPAPVPTGPSGGGEVVAPPPPAGAGEWRAPIPNGTGGFSNPYTREDFESDEAWEWHLVESGHGRGNHDIPGPPGPGSNSERSPGENFWSEYGSVFNYNFEYNLARAQRLAAAENAQAARGTGFGTVATHTGARVVGAGPWQAEVPLPNAVNTVNGPVRARPVENVDYRRTIAGGIEWLTDPGQWAMAEDWEAELGEVADWLFAPFRVGHMIGTTARETSWGQAANAYIRQVTAPQTTPIRGGDGWNRVVVPTLTDAWNAVARSVAVGTGQTRPTSTGARAMTGGGF